MAALEPGEGENIALVANMRLGTGVDLELHGDHAFVTSSEEGLTVVDISDPTQPRRVGGFRCPAKYPDFAISPDGRYGALALDTTENGCHSGEQGTVVLDLRDPTVPTEVAWIPLPRGTHTVTISWPYLYSNQFDPAYHRLEIHDLRGGRAVKVGELDYGHGAIGPHDTSVVRRADGRRLLYAASVTRTDVIDVTRPATPQIVQQIADPAINHAHQAEANHDRSLLLVSDEYSYGLKFPGCGQLTDSSAPVPARAPYTPVGEEPGTPPFSPADPANSAALHFYALDAKTGAVAGGVGGKIATFNLPFTAQAPESGCGIHVFWQAPAENRLVTAWMGQGVRVVDYENPSDARQLGWYVAPDADVLAVKPHRGYLFATDRRRGLDVLRYTGSGWPATAGPAEDQRAAEQRPPQASSGVAR